MHHFESDVPVAILTASRHERTPEENNRLNTELRKIVSKSHFGFVHVKGHYPETDDEWNKVDMKDDSTVIFGRTKEDEKKLKTLAIELGKRYDQESILFKYPDHRTVLYYLVSGAEDEIGNKFHPKKLGDYMSEFRGQTFVIDEMSEISYGHSSNSFSSRLRDKFESLLETSEHPIEELEKRIKL